MRYLLALAVLILVPTAAGTTYTVCPDGSGDFLRI